MPIVRHLILTGDSSFQVSMMHMIARFIDSAKPGFEIHLWVRDSSEPAWNHAWVNAKTPEVTLIGYGMRYESLGVSPPPEARVVNVREIVLKALGLIE